jgi:hypothetical protein
MCRKRNCEITSDARKLTTMRNVATPTGPPIRDAAEGLLGRSMRTPGGAFGVQGRSLIFFAGRMLAAR